MAGTVSRKTLFWLYPKLKFVNQVNPLRLILRVVKATSKPSLRILAQLTIVDRNPVSSGNMRRAIKSVPLRR